MPLVPKHIPTKYTPAPPPVLDGSDKLYLDRELIRIREALSVLVDAVKEIQKHLET